MARARTTKTLAKRIELDYFRRPHPFRTWMRRLSWAATGIAALAVLLALRPSGRIAWSAGDLTPPHALFQADCAACHARASGGPVRSSACAACHAGPPHHEDRASPPACASCHEEHRGRRLSRVDDSHCTSCHADLRTVPKPAAASTPPPAGLGEAGPEGGGRGDSGRQVAARVVSFPAGHPEYDAVSRDRDDARLRLNHRLHLKEGLRGPRGPVTLSCKECHVLDEAGRRMLPVRYAVHCASCHKLTFDTEGRLPPEAEVPHGDPAAALARLIDLYSGVAVVDPSAAKETDPVARALARQRARRARTEEPAYVPLSLAPGTERAHVVERVGLAVRILERQTCAYCHGPGAGSALPDSAPPPAGRSILPPPPAVPKPEVPASWMPLASFSHRDHRALACAACHPEAATSERTSDVLVPGKDVCATCHHAGGGAPSTCVTCHRYHAPEEDRLGPSRFALPRGASWIRGDPAPAPPAPR